MAIDPLGMESEVSATVKQTPKKRVVGDGTPGPGRKKGVPNKTTQTAKDAIARAAEGLGGAERLIAWAKEDKANERVFWGTIYPKLLPLQVAGEGGGPLQLVLNGSDVHG
jgi:hypothetical protein